MPLLQIKQNNRLERINAGYFPKEKVLQKLIEQNCLDIFGIRFIASEFILTGEQAGRIDTLGLDIDGSPTIIEYKRGENENVINQGLYYLSWLLEHKGDFILAARDTLGNDVVINWANPRLIVVAQSYAKWDTHAVKNMNEGIELWKYVLYGEDLLHLELIYGQTRNLPISQSPSATYEEVGELSEYTLDYHLENKSESVQKLFWALRDGILNIGGEDSEVIETFNKLYIGYRRGRNFCEVVIQSKGLKLFLDISFAQLKDDYKLARDVSNIGHWGTGSVEVQVFNLEDIEKYLELIRQSYLITL